MEEESEEQAQSEGIDQTWDYTYGLTVPHRASRIRLAGLGRHLEFTYLERHTWNEPGELVPEHGTLEIHLAQDKVDLICEHDTGEGWDAGLNMTFDRKDFVAALKAIGIIE